MVTRVEGWQDSTGKIHPTLEAAEVAQKKLDRHAYFKDYFKFLDRYHSAQEAVFYLAEDWDNIVANMK